MINDFRSLNAKIIVYDSLLITPLLIIWVCMNMRSAGVSEYGVPEC